MKPEVKQQWIKALRSRKYRKGNSRWLHTKKNSASHWSVLGVLTDLWIRQHGANWSYILDKPYHEDEEAPVYVGLSSSKHVAVDKEVKGELSPLVMRWAGLEDGVVTLPSLSKFSKAKRKELNKMGNSIVTLDDSGMSFKQMASVIDKTF